jgi:hypothetical protein
MAQGRSAIRGSGQGGEAKSTVTYSSGAPLMKKSDRLGAGSLVNNGEVRARVRRIVHRKDHRLTLHLAQKGCAKIDY